MGFFAAKKQVQRAERRSMRHNGHGKFNLMGLLAPLGTMALKQGFNFWRHARKRSEA
jgi:hypothetical protein